MNNIFARCHEKVSDKEICSRLIYFSKVFGKTPKILEIKYKTSWFETKFRVIGFHSWLTDVLVSLSPGAIWFKPVVWSNQPTKQNLSGFHSFKQFLQKKRKKEDTKSDIFCLKYVTFSTDFTGSRYYLIFSVYIFFLPRYICWLS